MSKVVDDPNSKKRHMKLYQGLGTKEIPEDTQEGLDKSKESVPSHKDMITPYQILMMILKRMKERGISYRESYLELKDLE